MPEHSDADRSDNRDNDSAQAFVNARLRKVALPKFPGVYPSSLEDAYAIQVRAITLWPDRIAGWKVGRLTPALADRFGTDRFIGPVFEKSVLSLSPPDCAETAEFPVFAGGSAAFEAEYVAVMGEAFSDPKHSFSAYILAQCPAERLSDYIAELRIGIEVAGSPLATMPTLDSLASIADFGNNNGQILGASVPVHMLADPIALPCVVTIDGEPARSATAATLPGGPLAALTFALEQAERIGLPIQPGQFVSTGAVTGMHFIQAGQHCIADFGRWGHLDCHSVAAMAI